MDDEDAFLYGDDTTPTVQAVPVPPPVAVSRPPLQIEDEVTETPPPQTIVKPEPNGIVAHLEAQAAAEEAPVLSEGTTADAEKPTEEPKREPESGEEEEEMEEESAEESDEEIEFIMEPQSRSLDLRQQAGRGGAPFHRPHMHHAPSHTQTSNLTTEYTPRERGDAMGTPKRPTSQAPSQSPLSALAGQAAKAPTAQPESVKDEGPDPSTLPPAKAPSSHPSINPAVSGTYGGVSIFEVDLNNLTEKAWRRPGSDVSDWFNYGFDELTWEAYCYRRRDMGELANVLKADLVNFAGMPEDQLIALPPDVRTMVVTGAHAMMAGGPNAAMMPGVNPNMMMDMQVQGMNPMGMAAGMGPGMNPMAMAMPVDMGMGDQMQDPSAMPGPSSVNGSTGTPSKTPIPQAAYGGQMGGPGMMNMNMGGDYSMQRQENSPAPTQQAYPAMEAPVAMAPAMRGGMPGGFRGMRGRGGFLRGRGRGMPYVAPPDGPPPVPIRAASPLPPNVPTGPRNHNASRYKDRDNYGPAIDGLDYGGNREGSTSADDDRGGYRKRRGSPTLEDERSRGSKRR